MRYIAGACVQKISERLRNSTLRTLSRTDKEGQMMRKMSFKKGQLLKTFRIREEDVNSEMRDSMQEIEFKQGLTRGLTVVSDKVFAFFVQLNDELQNELTTDRFHLHSYNLFTICRGIVRTHEEILASWMELFEMSAATEDIEEDIFLTLVMDLFDDITDYFIRIAFSEGLRHFKRTVPRKKKQALGTKVKALAERTVPRAAATSSTAAAASYICSICANTCEDEPASKEHESVGCDKCNCWFHFQCVNLTGEEGLLETKKVNMVLLNLQQKRERTWKGPRKETVKTSFNFISISLKLY